MDLTTILFILSLPFVLLTVYFGTKNDFYESENYKGDGCAHDVKRWFHFLILKDRIPFSIKLAGVSQISLNIFLFSFLYEWISFIWMN